MVLIIRNKAHGGDDCGESLQKLNRCPTSSPNKKGLHAQNSLLKHDQNKHAIKKETNIKRWGDYHCKTWGNPREVVAPRSTPTSVMLGRYNCGCNTKQDHKSIDYTKTSYTKSVCMVSLHESYNIM